MTTKNVRIRIENHVIVQKYDRDVLDNPYRSILEDGIVPELLPEENDVILSTCEGTWKEGKDGVLLSYEEESDGLLNSNFTKIYFKKNTPLSVTLSREGFVHTCFHFDLGETTHGSYQSMFADETLDISTVSISNKLLDNGKLLIEYLVGVRGVIVERCILAFTVSPVAELT